MGKGRSFDQLGLKTQPVSPLVAKSERAPGTPEQEEKAWADSRKWPLEIFLQAIEKMREDGRWDFADETLTGIYDSARERRDYSLAMKRAVERVYNSKIRGWDLSFEEFGRER